MSLSPQGRIRRGLGQVCIIKYHPWVRVVCVLIPMQSYGLELSEGLGGSEGADFFLAFHFNNSNLRAVKITHV